MEGSRGYELVVVRHKSALFTAELKPLIEFTTIDNAAQQEVGEAELCRALRKHKAHANKHPSEKDRRQKIHDDGIAATLYSPEYFGLQMPVGQRAKDRVNAARTAHYFRNRILPETLCNERAEAAWTKAFFQYPVLYHAFQWTTDVHRDLVRNEISATVSKETLRHRILGIQHLKHMLATPLHGLDLEVTLMCLQSFSWSELDQAAMDRMFSMAPLVFEPPIRTNDFQILNRLGRDPRHGAAMEVVTRRLGPWANWKLPGLASASAVVDLAYASRRATRPLFPPLWICEKKTPLVENHRLLLNGHAPGRGFFVRVPQGLPPAMLRLVIQLATLGRVMSIERTTDLSRQRKTEIMDRRNAIQYEFLCLPSWDELDDATRADTNEAATKACWLTAVIYVNAVLLGLHGHQGWHTLLSAQLWTLLTDLSVSTWSEDLDDVALWVLCVGGMAAFRSPARELYEDALRRVLDRKGNPGWVRVEAILHEFMWCDFACRHGASVLWQSL